MDLKRKLPVGIQDFEKLREEGYLYVDKTDIIYNLVHSGSSYFFARPRCFGKTLLLSVIEAYFKGRKDLFEGLKIEKLEEEWQEYTVLKIDFSTDVYSSEGTLEVTINTFLAEQEQRYGKHEERTTYAKRFEYIIQRAYETSGKPVVVLIDDYDKPILDAMFSPEESHNREVLRNFYSALNGNDYYLKFVFVTGISKFASVNVFNGSNKQKDISLYSNFNSLCAFTQDELEANFGEELNELAKANNLAYENFLRVFARKYSGYCFCKNGEKLYNPFSVLNALSSLDMLSFWFQTGVPSMLIKILQNSKFDFFGILEGICVDADTIMDYKWTEDDLVSVIFQSGYSTIRAYDGENNLFELGLPNGEVRDGFLKNLLPYYTSVGTTSKYGSEIALIKASLINGDVSGFVARYRESVKNVQLIQRKKEEPETVYLIAFHSLLMLTGFLFYSGSALAGTHNDIVVEAGKHVYIFEIKMDKGIALEDVEADAFARIEEKKFAAKYSASDCTIHKVVIVFSSSKNELIGWKENNGPALQQKEGV